MPEPDAPTRKTNSPFSTSTLTSSRAGRLGPPYGLETLLESDHGGGSAGLGDRGRACRTDAHPSWAVAASDQLRSLGDVPETAPNHRAARRSGVAPRLGAMSGSSPRRRARRTTVRAPAPAAGRWSLRSPVGGRVRRVRRVRTDRARPRPPVPAGHASSTPTPLASVDLSDLPIARGAVLRPARPATTCEDALGGPVSRHRHYDSGDRVALAAGRDATSRTSTTAPTRPPTAPRPGSGCSPSRSPRRRRARSSGDAARGEGLPAGPRRRRRSAPRRSGTVCRDARKPDDPAVTLRGLFGDAWLSCRLSTPGATGTPRDDAAGRAVVRPASRPASARRP